MALACLDGEAQPGQRLWRVYRRPNPRWRSTTVVVKTSQARNHKTTRADIRFRPIAGAATLKPGSSRLSTFHNMSSAPSQGRAVTSDSPASPTEAASSAAQQPAASATDTAALAPAPAATSAAAPRPSSPPQQPPASNPPAPQAPASSPPAAAAPAESNPLKPNTASPPDQNPPPAAAATSSAPRNANPPPAATFAPAATSAAPPPAVATSSDAANQSSNPASVVTVTPGDTATSVHVVTSTTTQSPGGLPPSSTSSSTSDPTPVDPSSSGAPGLSQSSKVAIGVVVPIAAIAILAILGLLWWRKRRARQEAEEERRKEVEDYAYNPNADPTMPSASGGHSADNSYEMREDGGSGYRGWGSTAAAPGSMGRKTSTTMSGGAVAGAHSDPSSPTRANPSEARSGEPLLDGSCSPEGEILGAMGPSAANNRGGDMHRGPSNASSSYSAGGRSEGSDGGLYGNGPTYYEQYGQNPYGDQRPQDPASHPVIIRDNPARRNTRIENSAHYPQQSAGIAQNF